MKCILTVALLGVAVCHLAQAKVVRGEVPGKSPNMQLLLMVILYTD